MQSGCGNCRFFATSYVFLEEQELYFNILQYQLKKHGRNQKVLYEKAAKLEIEISDCTDDKLRYKLDTDLLDVRQRITDITETMKPLFVEYINRYILIGQSAKLLEQQREGDKTPVITGPIGPNFDYKPEIIETTDFGLFRRIVEKARFLERRVICPEDISDELVRYMDILLDSEGSEHRLFRVRDRETRTKLASIAANFYADMAGDFEIQRVLKL